MSACDPKRMSSSNTIASSDTISGSEHRGDDETARIHHAYWRCRRDSTRCGRAATRTRASGVLMSTPADDPVGQARIAAFRQGLQKLGWTKGQNVRIDIRWAGGNADLDRKFAAELV